MISQKRISRLSPCPEWFTRYLVEISGAVTSMCAHILINPVILGGHSISMESLAVRIVASYTDISNEPFFSFKVSSDDTANYTDACSSRATAALTPAYVLSMDYTDPHMPTDKLLDLCNSYFERNGYKKLPIWFTQLQDASSKDRFCTNYPEVNKIPDKLWGKLASITGRPILRDYGAIRFRISPTTIACPIDIYASFYGEGSMAEASRCPWSHQFFALYILAGLQNLMQINDKDIVNLPALLELPHVRECWEQAHELAAQAVQNSPL